jgi:hypothetical protein
MSLLRCPPMTDLLERLRTRLVPALLTAAGVVFLAAGLMSFTTPVDAGPFESSSPSPTEVAGSVSTPSPLITLPPLASGGLPSATPAVPADRVATRIRVAALKIDLPVIKPGGSTQHPLCDVAMYFQDDRLGQPGQGRATYLYAHAQKGMFLPLLTASKVSNGAKMIGMVVEVWTSDDQRFLYVITRVIRHVPVGDAFSVPFAVKTEQLWLQTSEGVGTQPKLQIVAEPLSQEAAPHADAHPVSKPRVC